MRQLWARHHDRCDVELWTGQAVNMTRFVCLALGLVRSGLCGVRVGQGELACGGRCSPPTPHASRSSRRRSSIEVRASFDASFNSQTDAQGWALIEGP